MATFATASRLQLLYALGEDEVSVDDLAERAGLGGNAASQQLRILRDLNLVTSRRDGRRILYRLHDHHLLELLSAMRHHLEHATQGWTDAATIAERATVDSAPHG